MILKDFKDILKQINDPNEVKLVSVDLNDSIYWIFKASNVRLKSIFSELEPLRKTVDSVSDRFDTFINGLFVPNVDYHFEQIGNDFYIKFIRANFPILDGLGAPFELTDLDDIKIKGDIESIPVVTETVDSQYSSVPYTIPQYKIELDALINTVANETETTTVQPTSISVIDATYFVLFLKNKVIVYEDLPVSDVLDYINIYLYGVKQQKDRYEVIQTQTDIIITFNQSITLRPLDVVSVDFDIEGKFINL